MTNRFACVLGSNGPDWDSRLEFAEKDVKRIHDTLHNLCGFSVFLAPTKESTVRGWSDLKRKFSCLVH
jgi:hypothetical protein